MEIITVDNYQKMSEIGALIIKEQLKEKSNSVLGLATGSTPIGMYKELVRMHIEESLDFSSVVTFNLDEYVGISKQHPQSYHHFMFQNLFKHINIDYSKIYIPNGNNANLQLECERYEQKIIQIGGIDIQVLGIGANGHIGFNEPGSNFHDKTRVVQLSESTLRANSRFFRDIHLVPTLAISMGLKTILDNSKKIILLANGIEKEEAVYRMIEGNVCSNNPASLLKLHPNVIVILDSHAARKWNKNKVINRVEWQ